MVQRCIRPDVPIPDAALTEFVFQDAARWPDKPAIVDGTTGHGFTYAELREAIRHAAAGLAARGFRKGDVLALYSPNLPEFPVVFYAVATLGGVNTTINPFYTAGELETQLRDSGATVLVTAPAFLEKALQAARAVGLETVICFGESGAGAVPFDEVLAEGAASAAPEVPIVPGEDLVALPYSSGTTGFSKGVMLTHRNLVASVCQIRGMEGFGGEDERAVVAAVLPFFHIYGMVVVMGYGLTAGATLVTMPRFDLEGFLGIVQTHRVTAAPLVPPIILNLSQHPLVDDFDLSSLRLILSGGAPLGASTAERASARLHCAVVQGYGMTEGAPVMHFASLDPERARPGSAGVVVNNTEVKVAEVGTGRDLGPGEHGELCIRGPQVMRGYLNRPDATAEAIDPEGWYHSGDIGYVDPEGFFYIVDRVKELIKYKSLQVAPAELEALLLTHPAVGDAAVIPSPDEEAGEVPKAFIVLKGQAGAEEIMAFVAERVAPHKRIRRMAFVEQIPKSPSGKILRRVLIERERRAVSA